MNNEECVICMNEDDKINFVLLHENSFHKLCKSCYKKIKDPFCPFCRCNIKLHESIPKKDIVTIGAPSARTVLMIMAGMGSLVYESSSANNIGMDLDIE